MSRMLSITRRTLTFLCIGLIAFPAISQTRTKSSGKVLDQIIAVIGDNIILQSELETQLEQYKSQGYDMGSNEQCFVVEEILFQKLLLHQAEEDSVEVTEGQVESEMNRRLRYFIKQIGSQKKLEQYYQKSIVEIKEEFRELIREQLLVQTMQSRITKDVKMTPSGVRDYYERMPEDSLPLINSEVEVAHIVRNAEVSEEEKQKVIAKLEKLRKRIVDEGASFKTLAVLYSQDEMSVKEGGELGFMGRGELVPEYATAAFQLEKGQVSEVVETTYGYHIIQLLERKGQKVNTRHILIKPETDTEAMQKAKDELDSIRTFIMNDTTTFSQAAEKFSEDDDSKNNGGLIINPQTGTSRFEMDQLDPRLFSIINKLEEGEISEPVILQTPGGKQGYRLIQLKVRTEPHRANLREDYQRIKESALREKKNKVIERWINNKINSTYVRINDEYKDCSFTSNWMKSQ